MRIGIITMNTRTNYGGILQAYALVTVLQQFGHDAKVIYIHGKKRFDILRTPYKIFKRLIRKYLKNEDVTIFYESRVNKELPIVSENTQEFINTHIPHIEVWHYSDLRSDEWDALVVGSDQVWRPAYQWELLPDYFLRFARKWPVKKISYAPSFGTDIWEYSKKQERECGCLLRLFDAVSVRELSAVKLCIDHWGVSPSVVLDPTFLLSKNDYENIVKGSKAKPSSGNLLCYILDESDEKRLIVRKIADKYKLTPFNVNSKFEDHKASLLERIQPHVELWLRGFMDAEYVVTDSFHACVFSIIFEKPFIVMGNKERGMARFYSLLSLFNLENRLISDGADLERLENINAAEVQKRLNVLREESLCFIKSALQ